MYTAVGFLRVRTTLVYTGSYTELCSLLYTLQLQTAVVSIGIPTFETTLYSYIYSCNYSSTKRVSAAAGGGARAVVWGLLRFTYSGA